MENKCQFTYIPQGGVCSKEMIITLDDDIISDVSIKKGCHGNAQGLIALLKGMPVDEAIRRLEGIKCRSLQTSCPDQLAQALKKGAEDNNGD